MPLPCKSRDETEDPNTDPLRAFDFTMPTTASNWQYNGNRLLSME
jgi:hypothetical protein